MSSRLFVRHSGCFWEENLLNVAILHLGLLSLSLHQTSVNNVFLFSLSRWGISSRNRYAMQKLTTVSNPISLTKKLKSDSQWWVILWSARRWRQKGDMRIGLCSNAHSGTRETCENIEECRSILVEKSLDFCHGRLFVGRLVKSGQDKALSAFIWRRGNKSLHTNSVGARGAQLKAVKILLLVVTFPN